MDETSSIVVLVICEILREWEFSVELKTEDEEEWKVSKIYSADVSFISQMHSSTNSNYFSQIQKFVRNKNATNDWYLL